jgi:hypothetical protein
MKTLTTLTAVAALIAGMSIATAQNSPSNTPSSMSKGAEPTKPSGTQMNPSMPGAAGKQTTTGNARFCIESSPGGALECKFASMAACEIEGKPNNRMCKPNPNIGGTTGAR